MDKTLRSNALGSESDKSAASIAAILKSKTDLLSSDEAARYLGVMPGTLEVWRCTKRHEIPYIKVGRLVKYRKSELDAWLASRTVDTEKATA